MDLPPNTIFICYRRDDSGDATGRLYDRLEVAFGSQAIFRDVDTIPLGADFREHVKRVLGSCRVVLVVIGPGWLRVPEGYQTRRIDDLRDHVRIEVEHALARTDIHVIPVLVGGSRMPGPDALPKSLEELAFRNAAEVRRDPDFRTDADRLIRNVKKLLQEAPAPPPPKPEPAAKKRPAPPGGGAHFVRPEPARTAAPSGRGRRPAPQGVRLYLAWLGWLSKKSVAGLSKKWPGLLALACGIFCFFFPLFIGGPANLIGCGVGVSIGHGTLAVIQRSRGSLEGSLSAKVGLGLAYFGMVRQIVWMLTHP